MKSIKGKVKWIILSMLIVIVFIVLVLLTGNMRNYNKAKKALENKNYELAIQLLEKVDGYKDSIELLEYARKSNAIANDKSAPQITIAADTIAVGFGEKIKWDSFTNDYNIEISDDVSSDQIIVNIEGKEYVKEEIPGEYALTICAVDEAGNMAQKEIMVRIREHVVKEAYDMATEFDQYKLQEDGSSYYYGSVYMPEDLLFDFEDDSVYLSIAEQLSGIYLGEKYYGMWGNKIVPLVFGYEKKDSYEEMLEAISDIEPLINTHHSVGEIMTIFESLETVTGVFDYENAEFDVSIQDLSGTAKELGITEEMLGYIIAYFNIYGADIRFDGNVCNVSIEFIGKREATLDDFKFYLGDGSLIDYSKEMESGTYHYWFVELDEEEVTDSRELDASDSWNCTNRGLHANTPIDAVIFAHGKENVVEVDIETDIMYNRGLKMYSEAEDCEWFEKYCKKYIAYTINGSYQLIYYFNDDDKLKMVMYAKTMVY